MSHTRDVRLRYKFRCYPNREQIEVLARTFGACRFIYNWGLRLRTDSYQAGSSMSYAASSRALTVLKHTTDHAWLNEISSVPPQEALRHLQTAFRNFFEKRNGYPKFKKKYGPQSANYTRSAFRWNPESRELTIAKLGRLKVHWSRVFASKPTTVTITKDCAGRYFVTLCLDEPIKQWPMSTESVGVDLGISRLATLSNGERIANPKHLAANLEKLKRASRVLSRKMKGSGRRQRQRLRVARIYAHITDTRNDYLHKITTDMVKRFGFLAIEDLNVRGMIRNHQLARSLSDASLGEFAQMLKYKCDWHGRELVKVDRFFPSSKRCHICGHILETLPLNVREWTCPECGTDHDRDENAAINILAAGYAATAHGAGVRVARPTGRGPTCREV